MKMLVVLTLFLSLGSPAFAQEEANNESIQKDESIRKHNLFIDLPVSTSVVSGNQLSMKLGWMISENHRIISGFSLTNAVSDEDESSRPAIADDSLPPNSEMVDSESNSQSIDLSYQYQIAIFEKVQLWFGLFVGSSKSDSKSLFYTKNQVDEVDGYEFSTLENQSESTSTSYGFDLEAEYFLWEGFSLGYTYRLILTQSKIKRSSRSESRQYIDGVPVGVSDPTTVDAESKNKNLTTQLNGLYVRYYF